MKLTLECPYAKYVDGMIIHCTKVDKSCAFVHYKSCKGWYVLSPGAKDCKYRKDDNNEQP